jgi:hypothetical protein
VIVWRFEMDTVLTVKFVVLVAMEVFVIATLAAALIAGLVQVVRDHVCESAPLEEGASQTHPAAM